MTNNTTTQVPTPAWDDHDPQWDTYIPPDDLRKLGDDIRSRLGARPTWRDLKVTRVAPAKRMQEIEAKKAVKRAKTAQDIKHVAGKLESIKAFNEATASLAKVSDADLQAAREAGAKEVFLEGFAQALRDGAGEEEEEEEEEGEEGGKGAA